MSLRLERVYGVAHTVAPTQTFRRRFGVPIGGPFDRESYILANAILGLPPDTPAIELLGGSAMVRAEKKGAVACIGAASNSVIELAEGEALQVSVKPRGNTLYIAFSETSSGGARLGEPPSSLQVRPLRYLRAVEIELPPLTVNHASNRAGIRLDGFQPPTAYEDKPSEPCCVGAIQLTPSGQLIVVGPDGPTIGGYPRVGYVVEADQDRLAHLTTGTLVSFESVDWDVALHLARERNHLLKERVKQITLGIGIQT